MDERKLSIVSAALSASCCVIPLILLGLTLLGLGTVGFAGLSSTLGAIKWYLMPLALLGLGTSYFLFFRKEKTCSESCKVVNRTITKVMLTVSTIVVVFFFSWSVYPYILGETTLEITNQKSSPHLVTFMVEGMTCGGCEVTVNGAITSTGLADSVKSSFVDSKAYVWYSSDEIDPVEFKKALNSVGYRAAYEQSH